MYAFFVVILEKKKLEATLEKSDHIVAHTGDLFSKTVKYSTQ